MPDLKLNKPDNYRVAAGKLRDGWTYEVERVGHTERFRATVLHPYGDALDGGVPWPIEDANDDSDSAHPTYPTIEAAIRAAEVYVNRLGEVRGYPDPDKMSARGLRPTLW